jgi:hypothetical protein
MRRGKDLMLTAEELRLRRRKRRNTAIILSAVLVFVAVAFSEGRTILNRIKGWQSRRHADKAFALIAQENWSAARDETIAAYQLRPTEPQALRAIARLLSRTRQMQALDFWDQLAKVAPLTREDLRDEAATALIAGNAHRAEVAIKQLLERDPQPADFLLDAQLAAQSQSIDRARDDCEKVALNLHATSREQLQAYVLEIQLLKDGSKEQAAAVWARIENLAQAKDIVSLDALLLLAQRALSSSSVIVGQAHRLPPAEDAASRNARPTDSLLQDPGSLAHALESHPLARAPHKLIALDLLEHSDPSQRDTLIERGIAQFKTGDANDVAALARWLNGKGEHQRLLDSIPEEALKGRDAFLQYLDALGAFNRWADIKRLLESERFPLDAFLQRMYVARCNAQLGEKTAAENNWRRAIEAAAGDAANLMQVGEFAEKNGVLDVADNAYARAIGEVPNLRSAYQGRLRAAQASRETNRIHDVLVAMLTIWPNDTAIQNDEAYTRLLLLNGGTGSVPSQTSDATEGIPSNIATELRSIELLAEKLIEREPKSLPHRTLLALARLRAGLPSSALDAYAIEVPDEARTSSAIAVRCAALLANGRIDEAKSLISELHIDQLLPEERALIEQAESGKE